MSASNLAIGAISVVLDKQRPLCDKRFPFKRSYVSRDERAPSPCKPRIAGRKLWSVSHQENAITERRTTFPQHSAMYICAATYLFLEICTPSYASCEVGFADYDFVLDDPDFAYGQAVITVGLILNALICVLCLSCGGMSSWTLKEQR